MYVTIVAKKFWEEISYISHLKITKDVHNWKLKTYVFLNNFKKLNFPSVRFM